MDNTKAEFDPPEFIYLQLDSDEITWCQHRVYDTDIKYRLVREGEEPHNGHPSNNVWWIDEPKEGEG